MKMLFKTEAKLQKVMALRDRLETRLKETAGRTCAGQRRLEKSLQESACRQAALEAAMSAAQDITEYETLSRHHANIVSERRIWLRTWIPFISIPTVLFTIIMLHANGVHISHDMIGAVTVFIIVNATLFAWTYLTYPH